MDYPGTSPCLFVDKSFQGENVDRFTDRALRNAKLLGPLSLYDAVPAGQRAVHNFGSQAVGQVVFDKAISG